MFFRDCTHGKNRECNRKHLCSVVLHTEKINHRIGRNGVVTIHADKFVAAAAVAHQLVDAGEVFGCAVENLCLGQLLPVLNFDGSPDANGGFAINVELFSLKISPFFLIPTPI